jgi:hypothetical protein
MGLTIVLEDEAGEPLHRVEDPTNILHRLLPRPDDADYRFVGTIDWYGDTVFNYLQAPMFIAEWRRLMTQPLMPAERELMHAIGLLGERVATERHLYLKFYGD